MNDFPMVHDRKRFYRLYRNPGRRGLENIFRNSMGSSLRYYFLIHGSMFLVLYNSMCPEIGLVLYIFIKKICK